MGALPRVVWLWAIVTVVACAGEERRPRVPPSRTVEELRRGPGPGIQDCGEASESREDSTCRVHPVGECLASALKACRPAFGVRSYFSSEGDAVRLDWLVLPDGQGGCVVKTVEDRSADPLARKAPTVSECGSFVWKPHPSIPSCELPVAEACHPAGSPKGATQ